MLLSYLCLWLYLSFIFVYSLQTVVAILSSFMPGSIFYLCIFMLCKLLLLSYLCLYLYLSFIFVYALLTVVAALSSFMFGSIFYLCVFFANCCCYLIFVYDWVFPLSLCIPCKLLLLSYLRLCFTPFRIELWLDLFFIFVYACNFISFRKEQ